MNTREEKIIFFKAQAEEYQSNRMPSESLKFTVRAGLLGDLESVAEVCRKVNTGFGMSYCYDEFYRCMLVGANAGMTEAIVEVARCLRNGIGTEINEAEAAEWESKIALS